VALLALTTLNLATFSWLLDPAQASELASLPADEKREMSRLVRIAAGKRWTGRELATRRRSEMYPVLRSGYAVIDCYNPLPRAPIAGWPPGESYMLIDVRHGAPGPECVERSFFTQNRIQIAPSCPPWVCLNLGALNRSDLSAGIRYDPNVGRFCRRPAGGGLGARHPQR
jgi:hypothetical protein